VRTQHLADQGLVVAQAIDRGGVEEGVAGVERPQQHPLGAVARGGRPVAVGKPHAPQADGRHLERTDAAFLHGESPEPAGLEKRREGRRVKSAWLCRVRGEERVPFIPPRPPLVPRRAPDAPRATPLVTGGWRPDDAR
jgi:hypothetical protein